MFAAPTGNDCKKESSKQCKSIYRSACNFNRGKPCQGRTNKYKHTHKGYDCRQTVCRTMSHLFCFHDTAF